MTQSANILDISDDESKAKEGTDRGKENIPPNDVPVASTVSAPLMSNTTKVASSRKDMMTDEPRTPLGDLNPADYYAEGLDASSVVLVPDDVADSEKASPTDKLVTDEVSSGFTSEAKAVAMPDDSQGSIDLTSLLANSTPVQEHTQDDLGDEAATIIEESADIEIWESESAKDEEEKAVDSIFAV